MAEVKFEIQKQIGEISSSTKGWTKEVNLVSWNGAKAKIDIRDWSPEHEKMGKGITLTADETKNLLYLKGIFSEI
ncbi:MAG: YdbC family protein [Eisenbergiella sp.]